MNDVPIHAKVREEISYGDFYNETGEGSKSGIYSVMLATGYLTYAYDEDGARGLVIPNKEIRKIYADEILSRLWGGYGPDAGDEIKRAFIAGYAKFLEDTLQFYLNMSVGPLDLTRKTHIMPSWTVSLPQ